MALKPEQAFTHPQAEKLIHLLWVAYNFIGLYGEKHPLTIEAFRNFTRCASEILTDIQSITIHVEHDLIFCEEWRIEKKFCGPRLISRFKDSGIQSLSLQSGIKESHLVDFIVTLANAKAFPDLPAIDDQLQKTQVAGLRFNLIAYRKVASDEVVIEQNIARFAQALALGNLEKTGSLKNDDTAGISPEGTLTRTSSLLDRIRILSAQIQSSEASPAISTDEIAGILSSLRGSVIQGIDMVTSDSSPDTRQKVLDEMDTLTRETILHIIRQEYRQGRVAPDSLARLIRRLIPDPAQLRQLLPFIRKTLLDQGVSNEGYLYVVRELAASFETDSLIDLFGKTGEHLGLSVNEIIASIRKNPDAALRLIALAEEIAEVNSFDNMQTSMVVSELIEHISRRITISNRNANGSPEENQAMLNAVEFEMLKIAKGIRLLDEESNNQVEQAIRANAENASNRLAMGLQINKDIENILGAEKHKTLFPQVSGFIDDAATALVDQRPGFSSISGLAVDEETNFWDSELVSERLRKITGDDDAITRISTELPERMNQYSKAAGSDEKLAKTKIVLPKSFRRSRQLKESLQHEISRNKRYKSPFSCICMSVIPENKTDRGANLADEYLSSGYSLLEASVKGLRDLDIIGSLGAPASNLILLILPHTELKGAEVVKNRIEAKIDEERSRSISADAPQELAASNNTQFQLSSVTFEGGSCKDIHSVIKQINDSHKKRPQ
jgi:hypothetical protein